MSSKFIICNGCNIKPILNQAISFLKGMISKENNAEYDITSLETVSDLETVIELLGNYKEIE